MAATPVQIPPPPRVTQNRLLAPVLLCKKCFPPLFARHLVLKPAVGLLPPSTLIVGICFQNPRIHPILLQPILQRAPMPQEIGGPFQVPQPSPLSTCLPRLKMTPPFPPLPFELSLHPMQRWSRGQQMLLLLDLFVRNHRVISSPWRRLIMFGTSRNTWGT